MTQPTPNSREQNIHLPLYHQAIYGADVAETMGRILSSGRPDVPRAVGVDLHVELTPNTSSARIGTDMVMWTMTGLPGPTGPRARCASILDAALPLRRAGGEVFFSVFGEGPHLDRLKQCGIDLCRETGMTSTHFHVACFPGGAVLFDQELRAIAKRRATPVEMRTWMADQLGSRIALVRDREASPETTVQFLTGVDRIVKSLLPGYMSTDPLPVVDAALDGVRFLPCRHARRKMLTADPSASAA